MKDRKPLSSKTPPLPGENHQVIMDWMANVMPVLQPMVREIDTLIQEQLPEARYAVKWSKAYYGSQDLGWCIEVVAYLKTVNIVFLNGEQLENPPELGGETRYVKLETPEELQSPQLREWIQESCQIPGWA